MARLTTPPPGSEPRIDLASLPEPPARTRADLQALSAALDAAIPPWIVDKNLLLATWNLRRLGDVTDRWRARPDDRPKRDWTGVASIAEVLSRFDVIALQEVCGNLRALERILALLGPTWRFLMTDVNAGAAGNGERMAYVYDRRRVSLSGLAAELVVPTDVWATITPGRFSDQFARAPYAVSFQARDTRLVLVTLHINYGRNPNEARLDELHATARWLHTWSRRRHGHGSNVLLLGDFNIDRRGDALWQAFTSTGLTVPDALHDVPRSIFTDKAHSLQSYYDQIAWFSRRRDTVRYDAAGSFDFVPHVYRRPALAKAAMSFRVSDHYPLWLEARVG
ncbi:MAG: endonuclease/exonuclease/phosphatase family protein [Polyangiaceae bacterium]